jgi:hypothetical protein
MNGWSRNILVFQIEARAHTRHGKAVSNFAALLPPPQADIAQQTLKDPYIFDFLTLTEPFREKELEYGCKPEIFLRRPKQVHWAVHGQTAAEIIAARADAFKPNMGLTSWTGARPKQADSEVAKNYLAADDWRTKSLTTPERHERARHNSEGRLQELPQADS